MEKQSANGETLTFRIVGHAIDSIADNATLGRGNHHCRPGVVVRCRRCLSVGIRHAGHCQGVRREAPTTRFPRLLHVGRHGLGSFAWGWIADKWGRKIAFTVTLLMFSVLSGVCGLAPSLAFLLGARFLTGLGIGGSIPVDASILAEFAPARIRGYSGGALPIAWPVATFIASSAALVVLPRWGWRGLFFVGVVPALLVFWIRRNVPESPRWLANRGRFAEARKALHYLHISDEAIERSRVAVQDEPPLPMLPPAVFRDLFTPEMRRRTIHTWMLWVLPLMASWGMNFWIPQFFVKFYGLPVQQAVKNMLYISFFSIAGRFRCTS